MNKKFSWLFNSARRKAEQDRKQKSKTTLDRLLANNKAASDKLGRLLEEVRRND
jgi:hypothetical protein